MIVFCFFFIFVFRSSKAYETNSLYVILTLILSATLRVSIFGRTPVVTTPSGSDAGGATSATTKNALMAIIKCNSVSW